ncbi:MAG: FtsK/SpoIIIE domain-containing protein [Candidatus Promineifilaceae bacterium]
MSQNIFIDRPPRIQPELPFDVVQIPSPPDKEENGYSQLIQMSLPLITIIGYALVASLGGRSPWMMIPMALSVVASTVFSIYSYRRDQQKRAEIERAYTERLVELNKEMQAHHDQQRRFYRFNYPDIKTRFHIVHDAKTEVEKADRTLRSKSRLWERRVSDDDFGVVRLGIGTLPSTVTYTLSEEESLKDPQIRDAKKLAKESQFVTDIPVIVSLRQPIAKEAGDDETEPDDVRRTPVVHALGIAGEADAVYKFSRALLAEFAIFHAPSDARLYVLATSKKSWEWTDNLPHCQGDEQNQQVCFVEDVLSEDQPETFGEDTEGPIETFLEGIRHTLTQRKIRMQDRGDNDKQASDSTHPFMLVIIDLLDSMYDMASPLSDLQSDPAISILVEEGNTLGAAVLFLVPERGKIPSDSTAVIEIENTHIELNTGGRVGGALHYRYAETGVNSFRYVGKADSIRNQKDMNELAKRMASLTLRQGRGANLNLTVPFMDLMGFASMDDLLTKTHESWNQSMEPRFSDWLSAKVGMMSGNKPRRLKFSAKRDGVHGMIAGSTGSGKSELLISMITAMAVTYDPSVLNFVLVDYKGGGAFKAFENLPHCVDIITNLQSGGITRMFTAIHSELQRRQALNTDTGTKNIVEYRRKGLHHSEHPYPFLFIVIDEFAEMIADRPEYKSELETITRVGRAQGVSLVLAAQRPSGVTDQMRSNIKFRICLRVETPAESREMLRRTEAAFLPSGVPGRGYLQVGNEEIELVQVSYAGETYIDPNRQPPVPVFWPDRGLNHIDSAEDQEPPELYKAIINQLTKHYAQLDRSIQRAPWPDLLPTRLHLSELLVSQNPNQKSITSRHHLRHIDQIMLGQPEDNSLALNPAVNKWLNGENGWVESLDWERYAMRPVIGLIDDPRAASQMPLVANLVAGHLMLFGTLGSGKSNFARSLIVSLTATHSPRNLWIYLLDLGGRSLMALENLPHVGALIQPDEGGYEERVEQLLRELNERVDERKTILSDAGFSDLYRYNSANPADPLPSILLIIDNFAEFRETFDTQQDSVESAFDRFVALARQSKTYGIHIVITAMQTNHVPSQIQSLFSERMTLRLTETSEYRGIVGSQVAPLDDIPGRGYVRVGHQPLSFQMAMPIGTDEVSGSETESIQQFVHSMCELIEHEQITFVPPSRINALPKTILFRQLLARQYDIPIDDQLFAALRQATQARWEENLDAVSADWLNVIIGIASGNRIRQLNLEAKKDGVHGMIAGGTGSGKSELLMTMIIGLALNYDPSMLNFVLVDYKGGGAFQPFRKLPHCVDIVTNLNKSAVRRMFTAINAEMQRRQKLNTDTGTKDIVEYRSKNFHKTHEPYPHLFIIIDEYAEMITDSPEFRTELDSITRLGRAQGVSLILASQRPTGVSDQMRANIKFRICLRVEGVNTSREMLRRNDAAFLPSGMPGRGYLQIGNENVELVQTAYTGESYAGEALLENGKQPRFYDMVVRLSQELMATRTAPSPPWPPILPKRLTLSMPLNTGYLQPDGKQLILMGQTDEPDSLNPALAAWQAGKGAWRKLDWRNYALRGTVGLLDDPYRAAQKPLVVDLSRGHFVLFGTSGWGKTTFFRTLVTSLAATHAPDAFHAHLLDLGGRNLEVLSALPHVGTVIMPDERGYEERVQQLIRELNDIVDRRKRLFSKAGVATLIDYNIQTPDQIEPALLVAIDNFAEFIETFGGNIKGDNDANWLEALVLLIRQGKAYGLHFVISTDRPNSLNSKLYTLFTERMTLRLADNGDYRAIVGGTISGIDEIAGRGYINTRHQPLEFQIALATGSFDEQGQLSGEFGGILELGKVMQTATDENTKRPLRIGALPTTSSFRTDMIDSFAHAMEPNDWREMPNWDKIAHYASTQWEHNHAPSQADWLKVALGITSGDRLRTLALEAKKDGVHGLIAGGTGSGKSELLMTMIVGLALNYSPDILNFVLVDYKGGGAFKPFEQLPHVVDIVTNLNKSAVYRMFSAIRAEMRHRQALNVETGTKDIVDYRRKGYHIKKEPYPHLFIIIDEYAEMIDDNPEFRTELESITRVGRAQGVNLILASQRPKGVTDQMRANIKLRICLRVEQIVTSREMLRRPDAALLPSGLPGRGYLQVGNENLELIQVSWTGETLPDDRARPIVWPNRVLRINDSADEDAPTVYDAVVSITQALNQDKIVRQPWPGFLKEQFSLETSLFNEQKREAYILNSAVTHWINHDTAELWSGVDWAGNAFTPVVGLLDNPREAQQMPLTFNLKSTHLAVFGESGWGKTTFLQSLLVSLAATHSPDEFQAYILDLAGRSYRNIEALPHVGTVIYADEERFEERLRRLLAKLDKTIVKRQQILSESDATTFADFNKQHPDRVMPGIVVAIDNFAELSSSYEMLIDTVLISLVRRSLSVGISFVVASNVPSHIPSRLYNLFGERITFKQADRDRYIDIVGRGAIELDEIAGRGYVRIGRNPLLFQIALPTGAIDTEYPDVLSDAESIRAMAQAMNAEGEWRLNPDPIDTLPNYVPLANLLETTPINKRIRAVLGTNDQLNTASIDLRQVAPHFSITGPPLSGKTTTLLNWVFSLTQRYAPTQAKLVLIDLQRKFAHYGSNENSLGDLPHVLNVITEVEQIEALLPKLREECHALSQSSSTHQLFIFIDNFDDFTEALDESKLRDEARELAGMARRFGRDGLHFVVAGSLESSSSNLRRRILAANYGIGLRTAQSLETLHVMRRPAIFRSGDELPIGRGFIVQSGRPTMIQMASPFPEGDSADDEDESEHIAALDAWIHKIQTAWQAHDPARWVSADETDEADASDAATLVDEETAALLDMLKRITYKQGDSNLRTQVLEWDDKSLLRYLVDNHFKNVDSLSHMMLGDTFSERWPHMDGVFPPMNQDESA